MAKLTIHQVENAFQPAKEAEDPDRFAGRSESVKDCFYGLITDGSNIAIVGNRGIGKTSLARQVIQIASGKTALLKRLGINTDGPLDYLAMYFACGDAVANTNDLLEKLLTSSACLKDWIYDIPAATLEVEKYAPKLRAGIVSLGGERATETQSKVVVQNHSIDIVFTNVVKALVDQEMARDGVLIVVDEFDRIKDPSGFASYLKSLATNVPKLRFCLVGVAQDIKELMQEHESSDRLFAGSIIRLPPMSDDELLQIIKNAESFVEQEIKFSDDGAQYLVRLAKGHPYLVHLIGKFALRSAFSEERPLITLQDVDATLRSIAERSADPILEGRYQKAVAASPQRESVLRALAEKAGEDGEVHTTDAYKVALDYGVDNASQYVGQLVTGEYGEEIEKVRERFYRFKDSLFVAYILARPRQFARS